MPFRFDIQAPPAESAEAMWRSQIEKARHIIGNTDTPFAMRVLEVRKCSKRVRALLRLIRPGMNRSDWIAENVRWRDLARTLGAVRDQTVLVETLDALEALDERRANTRTLEACHAALLAHRSSVEGDVAGASTVTRPAQETLHRDTISALDMAEAALDEVSFKTLTRETVALAYARSFRRGRDEMVAAFRIGDDVMFHDWRKRVQHHWRQSALLRDVWPEAMALRIETARALSKALGRDHDASLLVEAIEALPDHALMAEARADVIADARLYQRDLRRRARPLAYWLYAFEPDEMRTSVLMWWQAALWSADMDLSDLFASQRVE
ncbi:MAG: CHAD domain-containing protein [Pseudomonadota bacterium]